MEPRHERPNVLITSAARKVPLVRAFRRATSRLGGSVIAAEVNPLAAALYEADAARLVPRSDDRAFIPALLDLCRQDRVGLLVPTRDEELPVLAAARDRFAEVGTLVLVSPPDAITACQDKVRFGEVVAAAGLAAPATFAGTEDARFPAFAKPRRGKGGTGVRLVHDRAALDIARAELGDDAIVQAYVSAPELTIDTFLDLDGRPITCVPRERISVVAGESVVSRTVRDPGAVDATLRLCAALGVIGHVTVQAFPTADEVLFIEVNPRFGGAANLGFEAGAFTPELAIRLARGEHLEPQLGEYEDGLIMLRSAADRFLRDRDLLSAEGAAVAVGSEATGHPAALFDLDDTLYPERQFVDGGFRAVAALLRRIEPAAAAQDDARLLDRLWQLHGEKGRGRLFDMLIEELTGGPADPELVLACIHAYRTHEPRLTPFPGIERLVGDLARRGVLLGVVSDGLAAIQRRKLAALGGLGGAFRAVVMTDELGPGHAKPAPDGFLVACRLLAVAPENATYVANDDRKDFRGARAAGLATIRFGLPPDEGGAPAVDRQVDPADDSDRRADTIEELSKLLAAAPGSPSADVSR